MTDLEELNIEYLNRVSYSSDISPVEYSSDDELDEYVEETKSYIEEYFD